MTTTTFQATLRGLILIMLLAVATQGLAAPAVLSYQGRLTNSQGTPVTTQVTVTFSFWDAPSGGNQITSYVDTKVVTPNKDGVYATTIGQPDTNPIPTTVFETNTVYLNVAVNGESLTPRQRITASAYALSTDRVKTYVAGEDITAGQVVGVRSDGKLRLAKDPGGASFVPTLPGSISTYSPLGMAKISATQFAVCYRATTATYVYICNLDSTGKLNATECLFDKGPGDKFIAIGNGQLILQYTEQGSGKKYTIAGTINGNTIAWGTPLASLPNLFFGLGNDKVVFINTNTSPSYAPGSDSTLTVYSVAGGVLTPVTTLTVKSRYRFQAAAWGTDKLLCFSYEPQYKTVLGYTSHTSSTLKMAVATLAGSSLQMGPEVLGFWTQDIGGNEESYDFYPVANDSFLLKTSKYNFRIVKITGTTPSLGPVIDPPMTLMQPLTGYPYLSNQFFTMYYNTLQHFAISGNTLTASKEGQLVTDGITIKGSLLIDATHLLVSIDSGVGPNSRGVSLIPFSDIDNLMEDWVGVAEQTVKAGSPCRVTIAGGITRQFSNLKSGRRYYLTSNGVSVVPPLDGTTAAQQNSADLLTIGKAISANELVISY